MASVDAATGSHGHNRCANRVCAGIGLEQQLAGLLPGEPVAAAGAGLADGANSGILVAISGGSNPASAASAARRLTAVSRILIVRGASASASRCVRYSSTTTRFESGPGAPARYRRRKSSSACRRRGGGGGGGGGPGGGPGGGAAPGGA